MRKKLWAAILVGPLLVNGALWFCLVRPQWAALRAWRDVQAVTEIKPRLEASLAESQQTLLEWEKTSQLGVEASSVRPAVQESAQRYGLQVNKISVQERGGWQGKGPVAGFSPLLLELDVTGNFGKVARWMSDLETQSGMQIDSWTLTAAADPGQPHKLGIKLTAFVRS